MTRPRVIPFSPLRQHGSTHTGKYGLGRVRISDCMVYDVAAENSLPRGRPTPVSHAVPLKVPMTSVC